MEKVELEKAFIAIVRQYERVIYFMCLIILFLRAFTIRICICVNILIILKIIFVFRYCLNEKYVLIL